MNTSTAGTSNKPERALWIPGLVSWLLIVLWMYAAASKFLDYEEFRSQLGQSPLLMPFAGLVAWFIPILEIVLSFLLLSGRTRMAGLLGSFTLMVVFTVYIFVITRFSDYVPCSCGGILERMSWNQHLLFNAGVVLLIALALTIESKNPIRDHKNNFVPTGSGNAENL